MHLWYFYRGLTSYSVAKFRKEVPTKCILLFWLWIQFLLQFWRLHTSVLATDSWQSLLWRRAESVEDYAMLLRVGNTTLLLRADSTYTVRSKCFAKQQWNRVSERLHLIHTLWPWRTRKWSYFFQHKFKSIFKGCMEIGHFICLQCWGTLLEVLLHYYFLKKKSFYIA